MAEVHFEKVESRTGLALPKLYLRMERDGVLHYGKDREDWLKNWKRLNWNAGRYRLVKPAALSCTGGDYTVYWHTPMMTALWRPPEYWKSDTFVSFAGNGYGDQWCWYPEFADSQGTPVLFCLHDCNEAEIFASNFEAFLFRSILESWRYIPKDELERFDGGKSDYEKFIRANVCTLEPYLNPQWVEILKRISERGLIEHKYREESLYSPLEQDEVDALLKNSVFTGRGGETFKHMKD